MNDPWMEWENDPKALALLDHYVCKGPGPQPRRDTEGWLESTNIYSPQTEPDPAAWEITSHAALIALGWIEIITTEAGPRGKPSGYKVSSTAQPKRGTKSDQELVGEEVARG